MPKLGKFYIQWLIAMYNQTPNKDEFFLKNGFFNLLSGDKNIQKMIREGKTVEEIENYWQKDLSDFKNTRKKYLLYPDFEN